MAVEFWFIYHHTDRLKHWERKSVVLSNFRYVILNRGFLSGSEQWSLAWFFWKDSVDSYYYEVLWIAIYRNRKIVEVKVTAKATQRLPFYHQSVRLGVKPLRPMTRDFFLFNWTFAIIVLCNFHSDEKMWSSLMKPLILYLKLKFVPHRKHTSSQWK
jgi:hypothetical protein